MTTNGENPIQAEIRRFDAIRNESTEDSFATNLVGEGLDQGLYQEFTVALADDPQMGLMQRKVTV